MKGKKIIALALTAAVLASGIIMQAVSVSAAGEGQSIAYTEKASDAVIADFSDMTKVTGTWDDSKPRVFDGNKLVISNDVSGNITGLKVTGVQPGTYKVGYFLEIKAIKDSDNPPVDQEGMQDWRFRLNPYGVYLNMPYYPCSWGGTDFIGLSTVVGQKIIAVVVIEVLEEGDIELVSWPRSGYMDATLDRIIFAGADHNFGPANYPDYTIFQEAVADEGDRIDEKRPAEDSWTPSDPTAVTDPDDGDNTGNTDNDDNKDDEKDDEKDEPVKTGDASVVLAVLTAGAAVFGGLKMRKR